MKLKPIISVLTLGCFAGQAVLLSGCVGQSNDSSTGNKQISQTDKLKSSTNSYDKEIWANITKTDAFTANSDLDILPTNNSDYDLRLVGCDNSDYVSNYLESEIPSKASPKITATYDPRWQRQDQGSGILIRHCMCNA